MVEGLFGRQVAFQLGEQGLSKHKSTRGWLADLESYHGTSLAGTRLCIHTLSYTQ